MCNGNGNSNSNSNSNSGCSSGRLKGRLKGRLIARLKSRGGSWGRHGSVLSICVALVFGFAQGQAAHAGQPIAVEHAQPAQAPMPAKWDSKGELSPWFEPEDLLISAWEQGGKPSLAALEKSINQLGKSMDADCADWQKKGRVDTEALKPLMHQAVLAYSMASAVNQGPMFDTKVVRWIAFQPVRPQLIQKAWPADHASGKDGDAAFNQAAFDMAKVGAPAKGLPALEWLIFADEAQPLRQQPAAWCAYGTALLVEAGQRVAQTEQGELKVEKPAQQTFNQVLGGLETLHWAQLKKPLLKLEERRGTASQEQAGDFAWALSRQSVQSLQATWQGIRPYLAIQHAGIPDLEAEPLPLDQFLRGLGKIEAADELYALTAAADQAFAALKSQAPGSQLTALQVAEQNLAALLNWVKVKGSQEMKVSVGFSASDGD